MLLITYKRKAIREGDHLRVDYPNNKADLAQLIADKDYFRCKSKLRSYANSDMADAMLWKELVRVIGWNNCFNLKYPPPGVTVKYMKSAATPTVTVTINLEYEPESSNEYLIRFNHYGNLPKMFGRYEVFTDVFEATQSEIDKVEKLLSAGFSKFSHSLPLGLVYKTIDGELFTMHYQDALDAIDRGEYASEIFLSLVDGAA
jgi:hypothetical protein